MIKATIKSMINGIGAEIGVLEVTVAIGAGSADVGAGNGRNGCVLIK